MVARFFGRWQAWLSRPQWRPAIPIRLPAQPEEIHGVRVHATLRQLCEGEARAGRTELLRYLDEAAQDEREYVGAMTERWTGRGLNGVELETLLVLADGVRTAMAAMTRPLALGSARTVLCHHYRDVLGVELADESGSLTCE